MDTSIGNGLFDQMCHEAIDELASGKKSWKDVDTNTLVLACFGMLSNHLASKLAKPLWWFAGSISAAVVGYIINMIIIRTAGG